MRAHGPDRGASTIEYAGLIVLAALILGSLTAIGIPGKISEGLTPALCRIVGGTNCGNTPGGLNTDGGRPSDGNPPRSSNKPPVATGKDPGLLLSLRQTLGHYWQGFENFAGFNAKIPTPSPTYSPYYPSDPGIVRELWEQVKGLGSFAKMTWCATGLCPHAAVKEARDSWSYIYHHPWEALKQAGYSIVEPCVKQYRLPDGDEKNYWYGRCVTSLVTTFVGAYGIGKLGKLSKLGKLGKAGKLGKLGTLTKLWQNVRNARDLEVRARSLEDTAKSKPTAANKAAAAKARKAANDAWRKARWGSRAYRSPKKGTPEYQRRFDELSKDPAQGGKATPNSRREAEVGLDLEARGTLPGPIQRSPLGKAASGKDLDLGEFFDRNGKAWDVKGFKDKFPPNARKNPGQLMPKGMKGRYSRAEARETIQDEINGGKNVILDSRDLSPAARADLDNLVKSEPGWKGKVIWYP